MKRIKKVQKALRGYAVDALIVEEPRDLFYLTGLDLSAGTLLITKAAAHLIVDGRYVERAKNEAPCHVHLRAAHLIGTLTKACMKIGFDQDATSYARYQSLQEEFEKPLVSLSKPIELIRAIKESTEVKALKKAADLCVEGFEYVVSLLQTAVTEKELAKRLEIFWLESGADKLSFEPIIAFGKNSSMPHYRAQNVPLRKGDIVLIDIGVVVDGYASDLTRTLFYGKPKPELLKIYRIVYEAQKKAILGCKAGVLSDKLYHMAGSVIEKAGYKEAFMHGLGHGIGLDVHEYPTLRPTVSCPVHAGMVVTIEPGIYIPNLGGVRIEDMVLITKDGHEVLTDCPKEELVL